MLFPGNLTPPAALILEWPLVYTLCIDILLFAHCLAFFPYLYFRFTFDPQPVFYVFGQLHTHFNILNVFIHIAVRIRLRVQITGSSVGVMLKTTQHSASCHNVDFRLIE